MSFCPEVAAGLPTPRPPAEIAPGATAEEVLAGRARVTDLQGTDVTAAFLAAARLTVTEAVRTGCRWALLTDGSLSCGTSFIHSGRFEGTRRDGRGVVAAALRAAGLTVFGPEDIPALARVVESCV